MSSVDNHRRAHMTPAARGNICTCSSYSVIVRVNVVLRRNVVGD